MLPVAGRAARRASTRLALGLCLAASALGPPAGAQGVIGAAECEKCHKAAVRKWRVDEPAQLGGKAHHNTHKQLADPKSARFAAALGQADPRDPQGRCVACHATVVRRVAREGVSCESCHGPASKWNPVHKEPPYGESYKQSLKLGMRDLHGKAAAIADLCVSCHVTPEKELAAAGHPNGANFDAGASLRKLVHWTAAFTPDSKEHASYDFGQITAAARPLVAKALASAPRGPRPGGNASAGASSPPPVPPRPSVLDWDQPLPPLPDDYPSDDARAAPALSLGEDLPSVARPKLRLTPTPEPPRAAPRPASAVAEAAELRGQALELLARLLERGGRAPDLPAPRPPGEFKGPDSELLAVQDIVLYLALETLRQAPPPAPAGPR